jgi:prepilin-type N-terminal cleavage/methylation domain-containing protein
MTLRQPFTKTSARRWHGFTLLEVLLVTLLLSVPVVAVQTLMLRSVSHGRWVTQQHLAQQAGETALTRIFAFHALSLWPQNLTTPGHWLPSLALSTSGMDALTAATTCINRWCSVDQWVAYEQAALVCALDYQAEPSTCDELLGGAEWPPEASAAGGSSQSLRMPRLAGFQATLTVDDALGLVLGWPRDATFTGDVETDSDHSAGWHQIILGVTP